MAITLRNVKGSPLTFSELDTNFSDLDTLKAPKANPTFTGTVSGITATMVGLGNVTNESKATMFTNPTFTGTVTGVTAAMVGLGNVTNESKATMFTNPTFTGTVSGVTAAMVGLGNVTNESKATMFTSPTFTGTASATTFSGALSGNATTATTLQTARTIWGQSFNGSADITGALTVASGGITVTGNSTITGTLGGLTGVTVVSGGVSVTGSSSFLGALNIGTSAQWEFDSSARLRNQGNTMPFALATRGTTLNSGTTLIYNNEITDQGGVYNNTTGVFTAPVAGVYEFVVNARFNNNSGSNQIGSVTASFSTAGSLSISRVIIPTAQEWQVEGSIKIRLIANETATFSSFTTLSAGSFEMTGGHFCARLVA